MEIGGLEGIAPFLFSINRRWNKRGVHSRSRGVTGWTIVVYYYPCVDLVESRIDSAG